VNRPDSAVSSMRRLIGRGCTREYTHDGVPGVVIRREALNSTTQQITQLSAQFASSFAPATISEKKLKQFPKGNPIFIFLDWTLLCRLRPTCRESRWDRHRTRRRESDS
jgi:hypothetical protein